MNPSSQPTLRTLSTGQLGIWVAQKMHPSNPLYNTASYYDIEGPLDDHLFEAALRHVVAEADALSMHVIETDDGPRQFIAADLDWELPHFDLSAEGYPQRAAEAWMHDDASKAANLEAGGPFFRFALLRLAPDRVFWYTCYHHLAMDGAAAVLVAQRVAAAYSAMVVGEEPAPPLAGSWFDLLDEQEAYAISPQYEKHRLYWRERLAERPAPAMLSPIPPTWAEGEIMCSGSVAKPVTDRLRALGERHGAGLPLVIIAATAIYLHRMTGSRDISIGIPVTARLGARTRNIVGRVSNILPLRLQIDSFMRLDEVLKRASARLFEMTFHQRYRSEDLRLDLGIGSYAPEIFGLTVNVRPFQEALRFGESLAYGHIIYHGAPHGLSLYVPGPTAADGGMDIDLDANPALYTEDEIGAHHRRFLALLDQLASAPPDTPVRQLDLLESLERSTILETFNANERAVSDAFVHELFEARVAENPEGTALVFGDFRLGYRALNEQANRLAFALLQSGVGPGSFVGIALDRSEKRVIAVLAVLKAGGAIVPLGVDEAPARLADLMSAPAPEVVLSDATGRRAMPAGTPVIDLDTFANSVSASALFLHNPVDRDRPRRLLAQHPAYVCIDGASGIGVTHASLSNAMAWIGSTRTSALLGVVCQWQTLDRIGSLHEILYALTSGMTLEIAGEGTRLEPRELAGFLAERNITDWFVPFRLLEQVVAAALKSGQELPSLRDVFQTGGEPIFTRSVQGFFEAHPRCRWHYLQGSEEIPLITGVTLAQLPIPSGGKPGAGKPVWNTRLYVLDGQLEPLPIGVPGELFVAGAGLPCSDWGSTGIVAQRFLPDPHARSPGSRMYRTGLRARWLADGRLDILDRVDERATLGGFDIDPPGIVALLTAQADIEQAAVFIRTDGAETKAEQLVAYIVTGSGGFADVSALRETLSARLPAHAVPSAFVTMAALPLHPDGTLDVGALPVPGHSADTYCAPRTPDETWLCGLFSEVLKRERVGIDDDFFALGGHSLAVLQLVALIAKDSGTRVPASAVFHARTVRNLAAAIRNETSSPQWFSVVPIKVTGTKPPLFVVQSVSWELVEHLDPDQSVYVLNYGVGAQSAKEMLSLPGSLEELAAHYVSEVQMIQPNGPYCFIGHSGAGLIAYEMAQQLWAAGHEIGLLGMIDTFDVPEKMKRKALARRNKLSMFFKMSAREAVIFLRRWAWTRLNVFKFKAFADKSRVELASRTDHLCHVYVPGSYPGKVVYWKCTKQSRLEPPGHDERKWQERAVGGAEVHFMPCHHYTIMRNPHVKTLAEQLSHYLAGLRASGD